MNLSVNARDAMPDGGTIIIKTENISLNKTNHKFIPHLNNGKYVLLTISDTGTGTGMSKEILHRIFAPFFYH